MLDTGSRHNTLNSQNDSTSSSHPDGRESPALSSTNVTAPSEFTMDSAYPASLKSYEWSALPAGMASTTAASASAMTGSSYGRRHCDNIQPSRSSNHLLAVGGSAEDLYHRSASVNSFSLNLTSPAVAFRQPDCHSVVSDNQQQCVVGEHEGSLSFGQVDRPALSSEDLTYVSVFNHKPLSDSLHNLLHMCTHQQLAAVVSHTGAAGTSVGAASGVCDNASLLSNTSDSSTAAHSFLSIPYTQQSTNTHRESVTTSGYGCNGFDDMSIDDLHTSTLAATATNANEMEEHQVGEYEEQSGFTTRFQSVTSMNRQNHEGVSSTTANLTSNVLNSSGHIVNVESSLPPYTRLVDDVADFDEVGDDASCIDGHSIIDQSMDTSNSDSVMNIRGGLRSSDYPGYSASISNNDGSTSTAPTTTNESLLPPLAISMENCRTDSMEVEDPKTIRFIQDDIEPA